MEIDYIHGFLGGVLIGLGAMVLMLLNGRVAGISGVIHGAFRSFLFKIYGDGVSSADLLSRRLSLHILVFIYPLAYRLM